MAIEIRINGDSVLNIIGLSIRSSLTTLSNSFSILVGPDENATQQKSNLNFKPGETALIKINDTTVINGFVDAIRNSYTGVQHQIEITGRDRTADFIDSSVAEINITDAIQFEKLLRITLDTMGLSSIGIVNLIPTSADLLIRETKNISSEIGQTGFEFIDQFARLKQVLLKGGGSGNIQMTRGAGDQIITAPLVNLPGRLENNVLSGSFLQSNAGRFNKYSVRAQEDFSSEDFDLEASESVANNGQAIDSDIRTGRNFIFEAEENSTSEECTNRAAWESDIRRAKGTALTLKVAGHTVTQTVPGFGETTILWEPNARVPVVDIFSSINAIMLIESVHYQLSQAEGSTTEIALVPQDSYLILAEKDAAEARTSIMGKEDE